jgi:transposase
VAIDAAAVYASAIRTPGLLPNAQIVVDHFHLVKLGNDALTKVRRRVTWELRDHRGRKLDPSGQPASAVAGAGTSVAEQLRQNVEHHHRRGS